MANAFVKAAQSATDGGNTAAFGSAVSAGSLLCGAVTYAAAETVSSVTDSLGNTYSLGTEIEDATNGQAIRTFWAPNSGAGTPTVTVNGVTNGFGTQLIVHEVSGAATSSPLGQQAGQLQINPGAGETLTSGSVTTATDGEYIFGVAILTDSFSSGSAEYTAGTGYTERIEQANGSGLALATEDQIQTSAGSIAATWTAAQGNVRTYITIINTFKAAAGGAASVFKPDSMLLMGVS